MPFKINLNDELMATIAARSLTLRSDSDASVHPISNQFWKDTREKTWKN